ncbi:MAG: hypothetical protein HY907_00710 [Deltaproteobacteria bacterium]|nr:hypothetical protein [Deltaproteobacteria bacterium]
MGAPIKAAESIAQVLPPGLERMRAEKDEVQREAPCKGTKELACAEPDPDCQHSSSRFCGSKQLTRYRADEEERERTALDQRCATAKMIAIPRRLWCCCGVERPSEIIRLSQTALFRAVAPIVDAGGVAFLSGRAGGLASAIAAVLIWNCRTSGPLWYPAPELVALRVGDPAYRRLTTTKIVAIDGFDDAWARAPGCHQNNLQHVLKSRYEGLLGTAVVTDLDEESMCRILGHRWRHGAGDAVRWFEVPEDIPCGTTPDIAADARPADADVRGPVALRLVGPGGAGSAIGAEETERQQS